MKAKLRIAVCGCGPAGLAAALFLHRSGHEVTVFERFAAPQPVGSGLLLQPTGLAVLKELGLLKNAMTLGAPIDRLFGRAIPSRRIALSVRYDALGPTYQALGIHRAALFDALYAEAKSQRIVITPNTHIRRVDYREKNAVLVADNERSIGEFELIVDALGANSSLATHGAKRTVLEYGALWFNAPWPEDSAFDFTMLEQRYFSASRMVGILPIGKQSHAGPRQASCFWSLRRSDLQRWREGGTTQWHDDVSRLWPQAIAFFQHARSVDQVTFAQYDHFTARSPYSRQLAHIGDAAHATSPQLGQGANMALLDALALSRALDSGSSVEDALQRYAVMRRWHVRIFQWASAVFTPFYQSDNRLWPFLRDWVTAPLSRLPIGDRIVAQLVSGMTLPALSGEDFKATGIRGRCEGASP